MDKTNIDLFKDITYIYNRKNKQKYELYKGDESVFNNALLQEIFKVNDTGSQISKKITPGTSVADNTDKTIYKVGIDLNVLDKSAGDITFIRKLLSSTCNDKCKQIDKSIATTFSPLLNGNDFKFFLIY